MRDLVLFVHVVIKTLIFMSLFDRLRHRNVLKFVPLVQHDYFSSLNRSDLCFLVFSLMWPSTLLELLVGGAHSRLWRNARDTRVGTEN